MRNRDSDTLDDGLRCAVPPERFRAVREWVLEDTSGLSRVRRELLDEVTARGAVHQKILEGAPEQLILVASELATNALLHGRPPTILSLLSDGRDFLLDVADHDPHTPPQVAGERAPGAGGFGLKIARRLAQDVAWYTTDEAKHIWAVFSAQG